MLSIGFPSCVQYALTVVAVAALSKFVSGYETEAVAALTGLPADRITVVQWDS